MQRRYQRPKYTRIARVLLCFSERQFVCGFQVFIKPHAHTHTRRDVAGAVCRRRRHLIVGGPQCRQFDE